LTSQLHPAGRERLVSYRRLAAFPEVVVIAGMTLEEVLAPWWRSVWQTLAALLLASGAVGGVAFLAFRGITREQVILDRLEEMVRDRTRESESRAREARLANESKTRFLAAASHDLRQPLQAAGMFVEVLAASSAGPRQAEVITKLRRSIESTNSLLSTLLDVSSLEAGRVTPTIAPFRLMPLLAGLVDQLEPEATQRGLSIGAIPTDARVLSDPVLLERLVRNLVVNAVRHTDSGGVRIGCRRRGEKSLAIEVWDTGIGIPADKLDAVFDDFIRLNDASPRGSERGLGLGLGVVRRMAQLLGHTVYVRSRPGKGSCFGVVVPRG
jgi:signal transduction histidine kinase